MLVYRTRLNFLLHPTQLSQYICTNVMNPLPSRTSILGVFNFFQFDNLSELPVPESPQVRLRLYTLVDPDVTPFQYHDAMPRSGCAQRKHRCIRIGLDRISYNR